MNKLNKFLLAAVSPLIIGATANAQNNGSFTINGKLGGLRDQMVQITTQHNGQNIVDSVLAKNDSFSYTGTTPGMLIYSLRFGKNKFLGLPIDAKEKVSITGHIDKLNDAQVTGANNLPVWKEWGKAWETIRASAGVLYKMGDSIAKALNKDRTAVDMEFEKLNQRLIDSVQVFVKKYPNSGVVPYIIIDRFINYPNPEQAQLNYAALSSAGKNSIYGRELGESLRIAAKTGIGVKPDFTLPDIAGNPLKLSSLKGKVVLVDFWASWCSPCRKENPNLVKAYNKYHNKGFEILAVSLDDKKINWEKAIEADKLTWLHVSDLKGWKSELALEYGIKSIPTSFLLDADGKIIAKDLRGDALEKKLATLFK